MPSSWHQYGWPIRSNKLLDFCPNNNLTCSIVPCIETPKSFWCHNMIHVGKICVTGPEWDYYHAQSSQHIQSFDPAPIQHIRLQMKPINIKLMLRIWSYTGWTHQPYSCFSYKMNRMEFNKTSHNSSIGIHIRSEKSRWAYPASTFFQVSINF
jgi:hypothetical protein